jgi:hypothetical protein
VEWLHPDLANELGFSAAKLQPPRAIPNPPQPKLQHAPNLSPPLQIIAAWEAWSKTAKSPAPQQLPTAPAPATAAESINANLCQASSRNAAERTLSSAATSELVKYLEGLKEGSYVFNWTISGHDATKQLRFGRRFAATYDQAVEEVRARLASKGRVHIDEVIGYFSRILWEEQFIDRIVRDKDRHFPAVVYLRALQEGECSFPYVLRDTPTAQAMMDHLALAYPEIKKRDVSEPFASIYNATVSRSCRCHPTASRRYEIGSSLASNYKAGAPHELGSLPSDRMISVRWRLLTSPW